MTAGKRAVLAGRCPSLADYLGRRFAMLLATVRHLEVARPVS